MSRPAGTSVDPTVHTKVFRAIRGLRLEIADVRAKFKYGGNTDLAHRLAVVERLNTRAGPGDAAAAHRVPRS